MERNKNMKFKSLLLTLSIMSLVPASHASNTTTLATIASTIKRNRVVQESSVGVQALLYATLTGIFMNAAITHMKAASSSFTGEYDKPTQIYIRNLSCKAFLPGASAIFYYFIQVLKGNPLVDKKTDEQEVDSSPDLAPCTC